MVTPPTSLSDRRSSDLPDPAASGHPTPGSPATGSTADAGTAGSAPFPHLRPLDGLRGIAVALVVARRRVQQFGQGGIEVAHFDHANGP